MKRTHRGGVGDIMLLVGCLVLLGGVVLVLRRPDLLPQRSVSSGASGARAATAETPSTLGPTSTARPITPTLEPTPIFDPDATPEPEDPGVAGTPIRDPQSPFPTLRPEDPYTLTIIGDGTRNIQSVMEYYPTVVIGTIEQILPARWTTPDGIRPANPHGNQYSIFRPATLRVERYIIGEQPQQELLLYLEGGIVGVDFVKIVGTASEDTTNFTEGDHVIFFLTTYSIGDSVFLIMGERYSLTADNQAVNSDRAVSLQQLLEEIRGIQQSITHTPVSSE